MFKHFSLILLFMCAFGWALDAQPLKVYGKITNTFLQPLPYATIQIREEQVGKFADDKGNYSFTLKEGKYDLIVSLLGYKTQTVTIILDKKNLERNIMLEPGDNTLGEVKVSAFKKDRAEEIIRLVIKKKGPYETPQRNFSCDMYIKAFIEDTLKPKSNSFTFFKKATTDTAKLAADSLKKIESKFKAMNFAEVALRYDYAYPGLSKETKNGVKRYGSISNLFYLTTTNGDFNFYKNLVSVPAISAVPFLSPISYSGLIAYRFRTISIYQEDGHKIYRIKVIPAKLGNALVSGEVEIMDSLWLIRRCNLQFPNFHMPEYDFFSVAQTYDWIDTNYVLTQQFFNYEIKFAGGKSKGATQVVYSNYEFDKKFPKKYFTNELGVTTDSAYLKDSSFWNQVRTIPLEPKEINFMRHRDSIYSATHTEHYLDSLDRAINKITLKRLTWDGLTFNNHKRERTIELDPILSMYRPFFLGGTRLANNVSWQKRYPDKQVLTFGADVSYGIRNNDLKGTLRFSHRYNSFNHSRYTIEVGDNLELINRNDAWINLLQRSNYYQHRKVSVSHSAELVNGLWLSNYGEFAIRRSVIDYKVNHTVDSLYGDILKHNQIIDFAGYNAFYLGSTLSYTPAQKYLREPRQKIILGSSYPTFFVTWRKGIPTLLRSAIDFDYFEYGLSQKKALGLSGLMQYSATAGRFITAKNLLYIDRKFMRQGDPYLFANPTRNFQALDSTFAVYKWFYEGHLLHEFNGAIMNKLPLIKKLKLLEVAGGGALYVPERNLKYAEAFAGLEKVFRIGRDKYKFGFYVVGSVANQFNNPIQFKIGLEQYNAFRNSW